MSALPAKADFGISEALIAIIPKPDDVDGSCPRRRNAP